jgi:hypothetical protein
MLKGKDFYVSGWAESMLSGFFRLETWIEVFDPPQEITPTPVPQTP